MALIPAWNCDDEPPPPEECAGLFDMGEIILDAGLAALEPFQVDGGCGGSLDGYVSLGEPTPGCCDILAVHLLTYGPLNTFGDENPSSRRGLVRWSASWKIDLFEGCYPLDQGTEQPAGIPLDHLHHWTRHSTAHGMAVYQAVWDQWTDGGGGLNSCDQLDFGPLTPIQPSGTCAGWTFTLTGDVP